MGILGATVNLGTFAYSCCTAYLKQGFVHFGVCGGSEGVDFLSFGDLGRSLGTTLLQDWLTGGSGTDFGPSSEGALRGLLGCLFGRLCGNYGADVRSCCGLCSEDAV